MRAITLKTSHIVLGLCLYGWKGVYAEFFPVYWTWDTRHENEELDVITIKKNDRYYFRGTREQRDIRNRGIRELRN